MDGPLRSFSWMSAKAGQQSVTDIDSERVDNPKPVQRPPTARSQSIRSANSEPPKPKVPVSLARRLLFPSLPPTEPLPPILTLGLDDSDPALVELNKELYDFLALALRAFVHTWWSQLTPRDRDLLPQITRILTHVIQDIEQRASNVDLASLVLRQIPTLIDLHINDYRAVAIRINTNFTNISPAPTASSIFRLLQPHVAIQPTQEGNFKIISEIYLRQLVENIFRLSLPRQDWDSEAERFIVREIVACVVLSNIFKKLAQPWFLHQIIFSLLKPRSSTQSESTESFSHLRRPSIQTVVIFVLSAMQTISGVALAVISTFQRNLILLRSFRIGASISDIEDLIIEPPAPNPNATTHEDTLVPSLQLVDSLLQAKNRLPASALLFLLRLASKVGQPWLDRLVPFVLSRAISPSSLIHVTQTLKRTLFPNDGWPGPTPADPTVEEQLLIREQLEERLRELCRPWTANILLGNSRKIQALTIKQALDPFSESAEINSHLLVVLLDLVVSDLWPELNASKAV